MKPIGNTFAAYSYINYYYYNSIPENFINDDFNPTMGR
jgi:hypothetical protein